MQELLNVGAAAAETGWSARMLRYLEQHGLVVPRRTPSGYRAYGLPELNRLRSLRVLRRRFGIDLAELESRPPGLDEPRLVLLPVELQRERMPGLHEEHLAAVDVGERPDELVTPRLLDLADLEPPTVERVDVRGVHGEQAYAASHSGCASTCSCAARSSFGVFTVSQSPAWRNARSLPSAASSGNVVDS